MFEASKDYWFVNQISPTILNYRWEKKNPRPVGASKERREAYWAKQKAAWAENKRVFDEGRVKLKAVGYGKQRDFPVTQEKKARAYAAMVTKQTGVEMEVNKGFYLAF